MFDLCFKFNCVPGITHLTHTHYEGNVSADREKPITCLDSYLRNTKIHNSCATGCADITFETKANKVRTYVSSKRFDQSHKETNKVKKDVASYGISNIVSLPKFDKKSDKIWLVVFDRDDFEKKQAKNNTYIKKYVSRVFDATDLANMYPLLRKTIVQLKSYDDLLSRKILNLYFHQQGIATGIVKAFNAGSRQVLIGAKPRAGKTYICGGVIAALKPRNVLVITPAPSETKKQFIDDLFHAHVEFKHYKIIDLTGASTPQLDDILDESTTGKIIIVSKQFLHTKIKDCVIPALKDLTFDMEINDENHHGGCTALSKMIHHEYNTNKECLTLYMTGTYMKPLCTWGFEEHECFYWSMEDDFKAKNVTLPENTAYFKEKFGDDCFDNHSYDQIVECYSREPELCLMTTMFQQDYYADLKVDLSQDDTDPCGFSIDGLFELNKKKTDFINPSAMKTFLKKIGGMNPNGAKRDVSCMLSRVKDVMESKGSNRKGDFYIQLWFLPCGQGKPIDAVSKLLRGKYMSEHPILKDYKTLVINSTHSDVDCKNLRERINAEAKQARKDEQKGLIILVGNKCSLGISLHLCDVVMLFNTSTSSDKIMQMLYRCMTEDSENGKKVGVVVDLNTYRVLNTLTYYGGLTSLKDKSPEARLRYVSEHLVNIDFDLVFENKQLDSAALMDKLLDIWNSYFTSSYTNLLKTIANCDVDVDDSDQRMLNGFGKKAVNDIAEHTLVLNEHDQELGKGVEITHERASPDDEENIGEEVEEATSGIVFARDILQYVVPFVVFMTMSNKETDLHEMMRSIGDDWKLLAMFDEQCEVWWGKKIKYFTKIDFLISKHINKTCDIYNIAMLLKTQITGIIHDKEKVLKYITDNLKPKEEEKKKLGAVYTPPSLINEMLDKLPVDVWFDPDLKWLDPAAGIGNFEVFVYERLMLGLLDAIEDEEERKKHILENMIYVAEIDAKSVHIYKQIFDGGRYELNVYEGDFLKMDTVSVFNVDQFDIIIGNPPYNKGGIRSHTGKHLGESNETIWPKFVDKSLALLTQDAYLAFVNPLSWLKKSHSLHNKMLSKRILWMKLWDNIKSLSTIHGKIPISIYVLKNTENIKQQKTHVVSEVQSKKVTTECDIYLSSKYSIPLAFHSIFNKLVKFIECNNCQLDVRTKTIKADGVKSKIPATYAYTDMLAVDTFTIKEGLKVKKATCEHPDMGVPKIILANKANFTGAFIDDGRLGLCGNHKFYIVGEKLEMVKKMLEFKLMKMVAHFTKYGQDFLDRDAFMCIPDVRKLDVDDLSEDGLYEMLGLSDEEIKSINNM